MTNKNTITIKEIDDKVTINMRSKDGGTIKIGNIWFMLSESMRRISAKDFKVKLPKELWHKEFNATLKLIIEKALNPDNNLTSQ